ncbi:putative ankyrin repeat protein RF_0381 [Chelonus insularis]|uniref:putative ankyrin repeat protein RF_0381 n=1 Tax=Chelonus insularis TaxID=460826 RepID=UPI00158A853E|nr:putative ankyrin repeat protein RF_0381 [Chelonus insularis]
MNAKAQKYATLCRAIKKKDEETIRKLVKCGTHLNLPSRNPHDSPLHLSIRRFMNSKIIKLLLKKGANTTHKNRYRETPLDVAVKVKNKRALALLLKHGNYKSTEINKVLKIATSMVDPDLVQIILKYEPRWIPTKLLFQTSKKASLCIYHYLKNGYRVHPSSNVIIFELAYRFTESENLEILEQIFKLDINVDEYNPKTGLTLLHLACLKQNAKLVTLLIQHKANVNLEVHDTDKSFYQDPSEEMLPMAGRTALYIAVNNSNVDITKLLLDAGALIDSEPDLMKIGVEKKNITMIKLLLSCGIQVNEPNFEGITPLHYSIVSYSKFYKLGLLEWESETDVNSDNTKYPIVEMLLDHGANVNAQTNEGKITPLHAAVEKDYPNIVKLLLKYNANMNLLDSSNFTPFYLALLKKRKIIIDIFLERDIDINFKNGFGSTPLHISCISADIQIIEKLLSRNVPINCVDRYGRTALHIACETGNFVLINLLLDYKADINIKNKFGQTPFHILAKLHTMNSYDIGEDRTKVCERFVSLGADINVGDVENKSPLFTACLYGCKQVIEVLLKHKADIHQRDVFNRPPIYVAAGKAAKNTGILKLLIDNNASTDFIDMNKNTIIHIAAAANNLDVDDVIDQIDVDINAVNSDGNTALHIAAKNGFCKVVRSLIYNGADMNCLNAENKTPVHVVRDKITLIQCEIEKYRDNSRLNDFLDNRLFCLNFSINNYIEIMECFYSFCIQLHKAHLYVDPELVEIIQAYPSKDMNQFEDECTLELLAMKQSYICDISWYRLLTCRIHDIAKFEKNEKVKSILFDKKQIFPLYQNIIKFRFKQGIERNKQMKFIQLYHCWNRSIFKGMPYSCVDSIFYYLDIKDILLFKDAVTGRCNK